MPDNDKNAKPLTAKRRAKSGDAVSKAATVSELFVNTTKIRPSHIPIRYMRWATIVAIAATFYFSFRWGLDFLGGSLNGSRLASFFLVDIYTGIELAAAHKMITLNAIIGLVTIFVFYLVVGGRTFCAWVCPYGLLAEVAEIAHAFLEKKGVIKRSRIHSRNIRYFFWVIFIIIPLASGVIFFEIFNPVDILNRAVTYGPTSLLLVWVLLLLAYEIFFDRRAWCRYVCPTGTTYGMIGKLSLLRVKLDLGACTGCGNCYKVCIDPALLIDTHARAKNIFAGHAFISGANCINCARCIDVCGTDAYKFDIRYLNKIL
jgi:ferredoxin-type protein NapH